MVKGQTSKTFFALLIAILIPHSVIWLVMVIEITVGRSLTLLMLVVGTAAMGLLIPLSDTVRVVVYFELKARKEGFDLMRRMEDLEKGHIRRR